MITTVNQAFDEFMKNKVNLDPAMTSTARASRDWLELVIKNFPENDPSFPILVPEFNICFGSFARRTQTRPLDDIDMMICLHDEYGCFYHGYSAEKIEIFFYPNYIGRLTKFKDVLSGKLNSRKIINQFVSSLKAVPNYKKADIKRNQEAATLELQSYSWSFDVVPCLMVVDQTDGRKYYLIPNGEGDWKKTNPRLDRDRISYINQACNKKVLEVIRLFKYWNKNSITTPLESYLLETMISNYYQKKIAESFPKSFNPSSIDIEFREVLYDVSTSILFDVYDPKEIQGNINYFNIDQRKKLNGLLLDIYINVLMAFSHKSKNEHKEAIEKWRKIFGLDFPRYG